MRTMQSNNQHQMKSRLNGVSSISFCVNVACRQERRFRGYKELIRQLPIVGKKVNDMELDPSELCKIYTAV